MKSRLSKEVNDESAAAMPKSTADTTIPESYPPSATPFLAPLLPATTAPSVEFLRRTLTSPWRLFGRAKPSAFSPNRPDRSCHATFGATINTASSTASAYIPRRSAASSASHRSLFTVDGLREALAPDPVILNIPNLSNHTATAAATGARQSVYSYAGGVLRRAATTALGPTNRGTPEPWGGSLHDTRAHQYDSDQNQLQTQLPFCDSVPRFTAEGPNWPSRRVTSAPFDIHRAASADAGCTGQPQPQSREPEIRGSQLQHPAQPLPPQGLPQAPLSTATLSPTGAGLLGLRGVGEQNRRGDGREAPSTPISTLPSKTRRVTLPSSLPLDEASAVGCRGLKHSANLELGSISPAGDGAAAVGCSPSWLHCDHVRNPMSFNYDPFLDEQSCLQPQTQLPLPLREALERSPPVLSSPRLPAEVGEEGPEGHHGVCGASVSALGIDAGAVATRQAPCDVVAGAADTAGDRGVFDNGDVGRLLSDGSFKVLTMKGPRGTPSIRSAATAAYFSGASASPAAPDAAIAAAGMSLTLRGRMASYFLKWRGVGDTLMPADHPVDVFWSWLGAFLSILAVALLNEFLTPRVSLPFMIASFGASAVLLFGVPASKLAQPRNFIGGQVISAVVGVLVRLAFKQNPHLVWLSAPLGMSLALAAMQVTRTVHPPGGASALIAASAPYIGPWYGFKFILTVFFGCLVMLAVSIGVNNLSSRRRYPTYWMGT